MPRVIVVGDEHDHTGHVLEGSPNVNSAGRPVARVGDRVFCEQHGEVTIVTGSPQRLVNSRRIAREGDVCSCGARLISKNLTVVIN